LVDLDGDGHLDILSGSWPGELYLFRGKGKGQFAAGEKIKGSDGNEIKLGSASTAFAADFNGDQRLDLLVGDIEGHVWLVPNEGSADKPAFRKARKLEASGEVIKVPHGDSHPVMADWNGDGVPDLIAGTGAGSVLWFRNSGTAKEPKLDKARTLVAETGWNKEHPPRPEVKDKLCMRAKVCVVDWNGDGGLDLLVGDAGYTQATAPKLTEADKAAAEKARDAYQKLSADHLPLRQEQAKLLQAPANEKPEAKAEREKKLKEVQEKLKPFQEEAQKLIPVMMKGQPRLEWHGHVWLYLRKPVTR
jgi:hypothetical protein